MTNNVVIGDFLPKFKLGPFDAADFGAQLADIIQDSIKGVLSGTQEDLTLYANDMAEDAIRIMAITDAAMRDQLLAELMMQVKLVGEINRLRATQASWELAGKILVTVVKTAVKFVIPL